MARRTRPTAARRARLSPACSGCPGAHCVLARSRRRARGTTECRVQDAAERRIQDALRRRTRGATGRRTRGATGRRTRGATERRTRGATLQDDPRETIYRCEGRGSSPPPPSWRLSPTWVRSGSHGGRSELSSEVLCDETPVCVRAWARGRCRARCSRRRDPRTDSRRLPPLSPHGSAPRCTSPGSSLPGVSCRTLEGTAGTER
jgi:hypothetical protein